MVAFGFRSFQFLWQLNHVCNAVELAPGADPEALEVARECLESIFGVDSSAAGKGIEPGLLLELFTSLEADGRHKPRPGLVPQSVSNKPSQSASTSNIEEDSNNCTTSNVCPLSLSLCVCVCVCVCITPHLSHEYCFYLTTILSTMSKFETHVFSYFPFIDNIVAHWIWCAC